MTSSPALFDRIAPRARRRSSRASRTSLTADHRRIVPDQGGRRRRRRAGGRAAPDSELRPHRRPRARGGDEVPALPPRRGGRLRHARRRGARRRRAARSPSATGKALADLIASLGPLPPIADLSTARDARGDAARQEGRRRHGCTSCCRPPSARTAIVDDVTEKEMKAALEPRRLQEVAAGAAAAASVTRGRSSLSFDEQRLEADLQQLRRAALLPPASFSACSIFRRSTSATTRCVDVGQRPRQVDLRPRARRPRDRGGAGVSRNDRLRCRA